MNTITVRRLAHSESGTISEVRVGKNGPVLFGLEDPPHPTKIRGDTRIPAGIYPLRWRSAGRWAKRFSDKGYPGSLEICDVPNYTDVLVHVGNTKRDTMGCLLVGMSANLANMTIGSSRVACKVLYDEVDRRGGDWQILYADEADIDV